MKLTPSPLRPPSSVHRLPSTVLLLAALLSQSASASTLMLDFGPTTVQPADATQSPAHAAGAIPTAETSWSSGLIADTSTGFLYSDGSPADSISIDIGRSPENVDTVDFTLNDFRNAALGGAINTGIYAASSPVKDGVFGMTGVTAANNVAVGVRINGLSPGTYTLYLHGRNTSTGNATGATPQRFYATAGPSADSYPFSLTDGNVFLANSVPANTTSFVEGDNYGKIVVTINSGDSLFVASEGTTSVERRGFINSIQILPASPADLAAKIVLQPPATQNVLQGIASWNINAQAGGQEPLFRQWRHNGSDIPNATNDVLTLSNVTQELAGTYTLFASNSYGSATSSDCLLNVIPVLNTPQMNSIWNLYANERSYFTSTNHNERGLAYNPVTTNLLLVSRSPSEQVVVLDAATGEEKHFLSVNGVGATVPGQTLGLSMIGVSDDGVVYGANLTINASSIPFVLYRWPSDSPGIDPVMAASGDPGFPNAAGLRYGDNMAVRGSAGTTQVLLAPGSGTNVVILQTPDGFDFYSIPPVLIAVQGVPSAFAQMGLAFGPGNNTFWAKNVNGQLFLIEFDLNTASGHVLHAFPGTSVPGSVRGIGAHPNGKWLAGVSLQNPDSVRLYDVSDLTRGPVQADEELFAVKFPNTTLGGAAFTAIGHDYVFALDCNNGIKAFLIDTSYVPTAPLITLQPADQTAVQTAAEIRFNVQALGAEPLLYQWRFEGSNLPGATSSTLTLNNISLEMAGSYSVAVSNAYGFTISSNALLTVSPIMATAQMTNIWNLLPTTRPYLGTNSTERGLAYNPTRTNLLLVSRSPSDSIVVLDALSGAEKHLMDLSFIPGVSVPNVSLSINIPRVADDGVVFAGSVSVVAANTPYYLYRWPDDSPGVPPTTVYAGNPGDIVDPNLRWGDTLAVRGAGPNTQVLLSPGSGTNVVLLRTADGQDFQFAVPPTILPISGVPSGFAALGLAFGSGNTFWAKSPNGDLFHVGFDLSANTGAVLHAYSQPDTLAPVRGISVDPTQKWLAGVALDAPDNVQLYDISNLLAGPVLRDQELFSVDLPNGTIGGTADSAFGGNYLFALDTNNGLKAFLIDPDFVPSLSPFPITAINRSGDDVILTWQTEPGRSYRVEYVDSLGSSWVNAGTVQAGGLTTSFTNNAAGATTRFYRVEGQ